MRDTRRLAFGRGDRTESCCERVRRPNRLRGFEPTKQVAEEEYLPIHAVLTTMRRLLCSSLSPFFRRERVFFAAWVSPLASRGTEPSPAPTSALVGCIVGVNLGGMERGTGGLSQHIGCPAEIGQGHRRALVIGCTRPLTLTLILTGL